jgi:hypothetical protein
MGVDLEAPIDNSILNYLSLIKCAGVQLLNRNNQTRNICSNSGRRRPELPRSPPPPGLAEIIVIRGIRREAKALV